MSLLLVLLNVVLLGGVILVLSRQSWRGILGSWFYPALLFKLLAGILLGLLYRHYFGAGDTWTFFEASQRLTAYFYENSSGYFKLLFLNEFESDTFRASLLFSKYPWFSNSFFLTKLVSLLNFFTGSSYYLISLWFSVFSFWGTARLAATLAKYFPGTRGAAMLAFLFFPSIVFWSSGLLKDSIMLGSMCWVVAFAVCRAHGQPLKWHEMLLVLPMLYLFVRIKLFLAAALVPVLLGYCLLHRSSRKMPVQVQTGVLVAGVSLAGIFFWQLFNKLKPNYLFGQVVYTHNALLKQSLHGPHIQFFHLEPTLQGIVRNAPEALFSAIYRPFLGESWQLLHVMAGIENLLLLLLTVLLVCSWMFRKGSVKLNLFYVGLLLYIVVAGVLLGLSTPNFGSLNRYRVAFLPFLVYLLLQNYYAQKLIRKLRAGLF